MSSQLKVRYCGKSEVIYFDDLASFRAAVAESSFQLLEEVPARIFFEDPYPLDDPEFFGFLCEMIADTDPAPEVPIQIQVKIDPSEIPDPLEGPTDCWICDFNDLTAAMSQIAPSKYSYDVFLDDSPITEEDLPDYVSMYGAEPIIISFGNVEEQQGPPEIEDPNEADEIPMPFNPVQVGQNDDGDDSDGGSGWGGYLSDEPAVDIPPPIAPLDDGKDSGSDSDGSGPDWGGDDDDMDWLDELESDSEEKKEELVVTIVKPPRERPSDPIDGVIPEDSPNPPPAATDPENPPKVDRVKRAARNELREWSKEACSIEWGLKKHSADDEPIFDDDVKEKECVQMLLSEVNKKKDKNPLIVLDMAKSPDDSRVLVSIIPRGKKVLKNRHIKYIVKVICDNILDVGASWQGAQVIRALLTNKVHVRDLLEEVRKNCTSLVKTAQGALTVQFTLQSCGSETRDAGKQLQLLNCLLKRRKQDRRLQSLLEISQHSYGSILMQVAVSDVDHKHGHKYVCEHLAELPPDQMMNLCVHQHGYLFVQALMATYLAEQQQHQVNDTCHDRIFASLQQIADDLGADPHGQYVLASILRFSPERNRTDFAGILQTAGFYGAITEIMDQTPGGPSPRHGVPSAFSFEGGPGGGLLNGAVEAWDTGLGEGEVGYMGQRYRFYRADIDGPEPQPGARVMFRISGTGHASGVVLCD